ncbi:hypothetical protein LINGRAHAP2_LOCUS8682 [Linum grandiflorum]
MVRKLVLPRQCVLRALLWVIPQLYRIMNLWRTIRSCT